MSVIDKDWSAMNLDERLAISKSCVDDEFQGLDEPGWVYVVQVNDPNCKVGPVKIGISRDRSPRQRIASIRVGLPYGLKIIGYHRTDTPRRLESALHNTFEEKSLRGEWFSLTEDDIHWLTSTLALQPEWICYP